MKIAYLRISIFQFCNNHKFLASMKLFLIVIHFNDCKYETSLNNFQLFLLKILSSCLTELYDT